MVSGADKSVFEIKILESYTKNNWSNYACRFKKINSNTSYERLVQNLYEYLIEMPELSNSSRYKLLTNNYKNAVRYILEPLKKKQIKENSIKTNLIGHFGLSDFSISNEEKVKILKNKYNWVGPENLKNIIHTSCPYECLMEQIRFDVFKKGKIAIVPRGLLQIFSEVRNNNIISNNNSIDIFNNILNANTERKKSFLLNLFNISEKNLADCGH